MDNKLFWTAVSSFLNNLQSSISESCRKLKVPLTEEIISGSGRVLAGGIGCGGGACVCGGWNAAGVVEVVVCVKKELLGASCVTTDGATWQKTGFLVRVLDFLAKYVLLVFPITNVSSR